jgi:hypothetical protein
MALSCFWKTPKVFNVDNPVQAGGAARGRDAACHVSTNPVGVEPWTIVYPYHLFRHTAAESLFRAKRENSRRRRMPPSPQRGEGTWLPFNYFRQFNLKP